MKPAWLLSCLLLLACGSPIGPSLGGNSSPVRVTADGTSLELLNFSDRPAFYIIYEREAAALIDWATCVDTPGCEFVGAHSRVRVPYSAIGGYQPGKREAIVWWWQSLGGSVPGGTHSIVARL